MFVHPPGEVREVGQPLQLRVIVSLARAMVGRDVVIDVAVPRTTEPGAPLLQVRGLTVASAEKPRAVDDVTFDVREGEILGFAGVEGNGQTELVEAIAGLRAIAAPLFLLAFTYFLLGSRESRRGAMRIVCRHTHHPSRG